MKNYKIQVNDLDSKKFEVIFSGKLVLENIEDIKSELISKLDLQSTYELDFRKITQVDLSFVQLLLILANDESYKNVSINFDSLNKFKDFQKYISHKKLDN